MLPVLFSQLLFPWPRARRGEWDMAASLSDRSNSLTHSLTVSDVASERPKAEPARGGVGLGPKLLQIEPVGFLWETFDSGQETEVWPRGQ